MLMINNLIEAQLILILVLTQTLPLTLYPMAFCHIPWFYIYSSGFSKHFYLSSWTWWGFLERSIYYHHSSAKLLYKIEQTNNSGKMDVVGQKKNWYAYQTLIVNLQKLKGLRKLYFGRTKVRKCEKQKPVTEYGFPLTTKWPAQL